MEFVLKKTQKKDPASYKSLYIKANLIKKLEEIAQNNNTSFNNVVISMIEYCLTKDKDDDTHKT